jgi:hypothetical protein
MSRMAELIRDNPIAAVIVLCEFGLWALLGAGLVARYLLRLRRLGAVLLAAIPLTDVVLVVAVLLDLHRGAAATTIHGLAGIYLGFSVAFGPSMVRWADRHFAHRFAGGPKPHKPAKGSAEKYRAVWQEWYKVVSAAAIASVTLLGLIVTVAGPEQEGPLYGWIGRVWLVVGIWFLAGPAFEDRPGADSGRDTTEHLTR